MQGTDNSFSSKKNIVKLSVKPFKTLLRELKFVFFFLKIHFLTIAHVYTKIYFIIIYSIV